MRALEADEKAKIQQTISPLLKNRKTEAACVYGSQVAGYARKESDYDVILVLTKFLQRIKYYYLSGDVECSVLAVDKGSFEGDCSKSSLGEFVSGRLLNPYEPLWNPEPIRKAEVEFKRRVIIEGLDLAYAENGSFAEEIEYELSYFLFSKLRRRAAIYPPVVYSYSQTYGEKLFPSNRAAAISGFRDAARQLASLGVIQFSEEKDKVKIRPEGFKKRLGGRIGVTATSTARGIRQYAVHGYAGRVSLDIVRHEVASKLSRSKDKGKLPDSIQMPKLFWSLPDAALFPESHDWVSDLLEMFGMEKKTVKIKNTSLGEMYSSAKFFTFQGKEGKTLSIAAKRYNDVRGMKWGILNLWALRNTNFTVGALERLHREYHAIHQLRKLGIPTPKALAVFLSERLLITQFIKGRDLSKVQSDYLNEKETDLSPFTDFGRSLAVLHKNGYCMGDSKPSNAILSDADHKVYLTDLEQAHRDGNRSWDMAEFIYYSIRFTMKDDKTRNMVGAFIKGYIEAGGSPAVIRHSAALRYRAPFQAFIAPNVMNSVLAYLRKQ